MHTLILHRPKQGGSVDLHAVMDEMLRMGTQQGKVYRTYIHDGRDSSFLTTSKDIHLALGRMTLKGQGHFFNLILEEFGVGECFELLVQEASTRMSMLATLQIERQGGAPTIHLSTAH